MRREVVQPEIPRLTEDRLRTAVEASRVEGDSAVGGERPAGAGARRLPHVGLGVVADAEGEEFHRLARPVLVRVPLDVRLTVQPDQHGGVFRDGDQEVNEGARAQRAEELVLLQHVRGIVHLIVGGGEVVMPEEGQVLLQRRGARGHQVRPPVRHRRQADLIRLPDRLLARHDLLRRRVLREGRRDRRQGGARWRRPGKGEDILDRRAVAERGRGVDLRGRRAETCPPEQQLNLIADGHPHAPSVEHHRIPGQPHDREHESINAFQVYVIHALI